MEIGNNILTIRKQRGLTIKDVAAMANVTPSLISQIENNKANPSLSTLTSLAKALNVNVALFFGQESSDENSPVTRLGDRPQLANYGEYSIQLLTRQHPDFFSINYSTLKPGADSDHYPEMHPVHACGVEFAYIISGKIRVELDGSLYVLNAGDSICYSAKKPHRVLNPFNTEATAIWLTINVDDPSEAE